MRGIDNANSSENRAYAEIMSMILSQEIPPGAPLLEGELTQKLKMSRTPIRAAVQKLAACGLLETAANRSSSVPILTRKDWDDLFELRLMIEPRIAELAAGAGTGLKKETYYRELLEGEKKTDVDGITLQDINEKLHFGLAELANNKYMYRSLQQVFWRCQLYICFFDSFIINPEAHKKRFDKPSERNSILQHQEIIDAVFSKNAKRAGEVMREHILSTYERATTYMV